GLEARPCVERSGLGAAPYPVRSGGPGRRVRPDAWHTCRRISRPGRRCVQVLEDQRCDVGVGPATPRRRRQESAQDRRLIPYAFLWAQTPGSSPDALPAVERDTADAVRGGGPESAPRRIDVEVSAETATPADLRRSLGARVDPKHVAGEQGAGEELAGVGI